MQKIQFSGYASIFNEIDQDNDVILFGSFAKSISQSFQEIKLLWQHDQTKPIGKITKIFENKQGLYVEGYIIPELEFSKEAIMLIYNNIITSLSIGYETVQSYVDAKSNIRYINEINLIEISVVSYPANKNTIIQIIG